jgi:hypothetical protein
MGCPQEHTLAAGKSTESVLRESQTEESMVEFFLDDDKIDAAFAGDRTVEEALRYVQSDLCPPGRMVVGLRCDGLDVHGDAMAATLGKPASSFQRLDVFTDTKGALVAEAMIQAAASLRQTETECGHVAELLIEGKTTQGIEALAFCVGAWQQIHEAVSKSIQMLGLDPEKTTINGQALLEAIAKPKEALLQVTNALQSQDHVLLADVLQYEFGDVTEQWYAIITDLRERAQELPSGRMKDEG